jgi:hypothetical protein
MRKVSYQKGRKMNTEVGLFSFMVFFSFSMQIARRAVPVKLR